MKAVPRRLPELVVTEATFALWQKLVQFPAGDVDAALRCVQEWIAGAIDADNVIWIGAVRVLHGATAKKDPFFGWRLRARAPMRPDPEPYRRLQARYYASDHYGKLTSTYYRRSHAEKLMHVGMTGRASLAGAGVFRVHRLRDGDFIDYAAFKRTEHYRLYYDEPGIVDRMTIGFPVTANTESFFLIDRFRRAPGVRRRPFTAHDAALAGGAVRGMPMLHRQLILSHGLLAGDKLLSPVERQILKGLIGGDAEKRIAASLGQKPATLHKYVTALYARLGVSSRAALTAHWLGPWRAPLFRGLFEALLFASIEDDDSGRATAQPDRVSRSIQQGDRRVEFHWRVPCTRAEARTRLDRRGRSACAPVGNNSCKRRVCRRYRQRARMCRLRPGMARRQLFVVDVSRRSRRFRYGGNPMHHCVKTLLFVVLVLLEAFGTPAQAQTQSFTSVRVWPSVSAYGQYVTIQASVLPYCTGCNAPQPTGSVDFFVDGVLFGSSFVGSPSIGLIITNTLSVGNQHTVVATYSGDSNNAGSTSPEATAAVVPASTTTTIAPHGPLPLGQSLNVSVNVSVQQPGAGTPTGGVVVSDGVGDTCTIALPAASCSLTPSAPGALTLVARYSGDANFNPSNGVATLNVTSGARTVGGSVGGLAGNGLVLHLDHAGGSEDLPVDVGSTLFAFTSPVAYGSFYSVSVAMQPTNPRQTCTVVNGLGTMQGSDVTNVAVNCVTGMYSVGGTVGGLSGSGLVLRINDGGDLAINGNGSFAFPPMTDGAAYAVTVAAQPTNPDQVCAVALGQGALAGADVTNVAVTCATLYTVGGVISGLNGTLVLQLNGGGDLQVSSGGGPASFTFAAPIPNGSSYAVTILQSPPNQTCFISNASGLIADANVTSVFVSCQGGDPPVLMLTVDDGREYARYGQMLQYIVTLTNVGGSAASGVPVSGIFGPALDEANAQWQCTPDGGATCSPTGVGALSDLADIPPGGTAVWIVQVPVLSETDAPTTVFTVSAASIVSDVDALVIFRDGLDGE